MLHTPLCRYYASAPLYFSLSARASAMLLPALRGARGVAAH